MTEMRRYTRSSSFKMALLFAVLLGLSVTVLGYFGYYFARGHFIHSSEEVIDTEIRHLAALPSPALQHALTAPAPRRIYLLSSADGRYLSGNLRQLPEDFSVLAEGSLFFTDADGQRYVARFHNFADGRRLLVGVDVTATVHDYNILLGLCLLSIVLMLVVIGVSFIISTFVVSRTNRIAATAKQIMDTGNLSQRLTVDSQWDDLSYLAGVLNDFLARTQSLVDGVQRVSDNIAHDLRTPLTRLRNQLEALPGADSAALIAEADQLLATFNALLRIAHIETAQQKTCFARTDLALILADVAELYEPSAQDKNISFACVLSPAVVQGDRDLLFQAFANLLDNAIKFTPTGGRITLTLDTTAAAPRVTLTDSGQGIPECDKARVFDRFFRSDASRHTPGNGLGLSLVAAVMALHGAIIRLEDATPGLRVVITFRATLQLFNDGRAESCV